MAIPEGYSFLAKLGISYKGDYSEEVTYEQFNAVYYNGSTYIALVDNPTGPPSADGTNWQYMAKGFVGQIISSISNLNATDKNGVIGDAGETVNAQELIDGMSDDISDKLDKTGDASNTTAIFDQASERTNIISGENQSTFRGKIKKWFADLTVAAFAQIITSNTDLMATTVAGYLVDALAVKQQFDVVNSNLDPLKSRALTVVYNSYASLDTNNSQCYTQNGWCFLSVYVTSTTSTAGWQKVGSIDGVLPAFSKDILQEVVVSYDCTAWCIFRIKLDGSIIVMPKASGKTYLWTICFPYEDK